MRGRGPRGRWSGGGGRSWGEGEEARGKFFPGGEPGRAKGGGRTGRFKGGGEGPTGERARRSAPLMAPGGGKPNNPGREREKGGKGDQGFFPFQGGRRRRDSRGGGA